MAKPTVSIICPSLRTHYWMRLYHSLIGNNIDFEIIFIGFNNSNFPIPRNCRFIYSEVKTPQCFHIGALNAQGNFLIWTSDDCIFSNTAIDIAHSALSNTDTQNTMIVFRGDWKIIDSNSGKAVKGRVGLLKHLYFLGARGKRYIQNGRYSPIVSNSGFIMRKNLYFDLGGLDTRFIQRFVDIDLCLRLYERGGSVEPCLTAAMEEIRFTENDTLENDDKYDTSWVDIGLLYSLWCKDDRCQSRYSLNNRAPVKTKEDYYKMEQLASNMQLSVLTTRSDPVSTFSDIDILTMSQGPTKLCDII